VPGRAYNDKIRAPILQRQKQKNDQGKTIEITSLVLEWKKLRVTFLHAKQTLKYIRGFA
jgi:hypothetical protein